jgi:hypothetical protein
LLRRAGRQGFQELRHVGGAQGAGMLPAVKADVLFDPANQRFGILGGGALAEGLADAVEELGRCRCRGGRGRWPGGLGRCGVALPSRFGLRYLAVGPLCCRRWGERWRPRRGERRGGCEQAGFLREAILVIPIHRFTVKRKSREQPILLAWTGATGIIGLGRARGLIAQRAWSLRGARLAFVVSGARVNEIVRRGATGWFANCEGCRREYGATARSGN